jgi:hypothetical protein
MGEGRFSLCLADKDVTTTVVKPSIMVLIATLNVFSYRIQSFNTSLGLRPIFGRGEINEQKIFQSGTT